jgi:hypothetical protein
MLGEGEAGRLKTDHPRSLSTLLGTKSTYRSIVPGSGRAPSGTPHPDSLSDAEDTAGELNQGRMEIESAEELSSSLVRRHTVP